MATLSSKLILSLIDRVSGPARGISGALARMDRQVDMLRRSQMAAFAPMRGFAGRLLAYGGAYIGITKGIEGTAGAAMSFESAMADVRKVVDVSDEAFANMKRSVAGLSRELPVSANGIAAIYAAAGQSGIATNELKGFAEGVVKVSTAWDTSVETTGEALAKIKTALHRDLKGTFLLADAINQVSNVSAAAAPDLLNYTNRVAAFAETAGFSAEQALAFGAAMIGSGFEPEVAATSFRNLTSRLTMGEKATKKQRVAFKELGLEAVKTAKGMQKNAVDTTLDVLDRIKKLPEYQQLSVARALFGDEARGLAPLFKNQAELRRLLRETGDAANYSGSAFQEYVVRANTASNVLAILRNKIADVFRGIGDDMLPGIKEAALGVGDVLDSLGERASIFDKVSASVKGFLKGLGYDGTVRDAINSLGDLLFGKADGGGAADQLGQLFAQFERGGAAIRSFVDASQDSPILGLLGEISGYGFSLAVAGLGIGLLAGAVSGLARALFLLSGAKTAIGILKALGRGGAWAANAAGIGAGAATIANAADPSRTPGPKTPPGAIGATLAAFLSSFALPAIGPLAAAWAAIEFGPQAAARSRKPKKGEPGWWMGIDPTEDRQQRLDRLNQANMRWTTGPMSRGGRGPAEVRPTGVVDGRVDWARPESRSNTFSRMLDGMDRPQPQAENVADSLNRVIMQTRPVGVADVNVTNPIRPNVSVSVMVNATTNASPQEIGAAVGDRVRAEVESVYSDGAM